MNFGEQDKKKNQQKVTNHDQVWDRLQYIEINHTLGMYQFFRPVSQISYKQKSRCGCYTLFFYLRIFTKDVYLTLKIHRCRLAHAKLFNQNMNCTNYSWFLSATFQLEYKITLDWSTSTRYAFSSKEHLL